MTIQCGGAGVPDIQGGIHDSENSCPCSWIDEDCHASLARWSRIISRSLMYLRGRDQTIM